MKRGEMLNAALVCAVNAHSGQFDRGGKPYIMHPLAVMNMLDDSADEELQCIAILHDVVEDTKTTWNDLIAIGMTERVIVALKLLTKVPGQSHDEYVNGIMTNVDAMKVKLRDLRHNSELTRLKGISDKDIERTVKYQKMFYQIHQKLQQEE